MSVVLIITGDRQGDDGHEVGAELWRIPFAGWGELHELRAEAWCVPRRSAVVEGNRVLAADFTSNDPTVMRGEVFRIRVPAPPTP